MTQMKQASVPRSLLGWKKDGCLENGSFVFEGFLNGMGLDGWFLIDVFCAWFVGACFCQTHVSGLVWLFSCVLMVLWVPRFVVFSRLRLATARAVKVFPVPGGP